MAYPTPNEIADQMGREPHVGDMMIVPNSRYPGPYRIDRVMRFEQDPAGEDMFISSDASVGLVAAHEDAPYYRITFDYARTGRPFHWVVSIGEYRATGELADDDEFGEDDDTTVPLLWDDSERRWVLTLQMGDRPQ